MIENISLPHDLDMAIGSESRDFAVKADRAQPLKSSFLLILLGVGWLAFTSIFVFAFLGPIFRGKEVHFTVDDVPTVAGPGNLRPILIPALIIGVFVLVGVVILGFGIYALMKKGGYFIGTPTMLVNYQKGKMRSIDWEQFSGDIEVNGNAQKGSISLQMRTGKMVSRKDGPDRSCS